MNRQTSQRVFRTALIFGVSGLISASLQAKISEPDHILYGNATYFDSALANGSTVSLVVAGQGVPLVEYSIGSDVALGSYYALRIPMDSVDPREPGTARPGEQVTLYIDGEPAAMTQVGEHGKAVRLDIDPNDLNGGGPGILVNDVSTVEGNSGRSNLTFTVSLARNNDQAVSVDWATSDLAAAGGADCSIGIDYITASGVATVPSGSMNTNFTVEICGDTEDEAEEMFKVALSNPVNGFVAVGNGYGTILDDDTQPTLSIDDIQVVEPSSGSTGAVFTVSLSQIWHTTIMVDYMVAAQTAAGGVDFNPVSGTLTIDAGSPTGNISVPVFADDVFEPNETFSVTLQNAFNADLLDDTGIGTIIDPAFEPLLAITGSEVLASASPSAVVVSPDGLHVYVAGLANDSITAFERQQGAGSLIYVTRYDAAVSGFEGMLLDGVTDIAISSDGAYLFAVASKDKALNVFARNAMTSELSHLAAIDDAMLDGAISLALSPDNHHVYVAAEVANSLSVYAWDAATESLSFIQTKTDGAASVDGINDASSVAVSADGRHVYVTGAGDDNAIAVFARDDAPASAGFGGLAYTGLVRNELADVKGIDGVSSVAVSPDGAYLYATGEVGNALAQFEREPWGGDLSWMAEELQGDNGVAGLKGPIKVAVSQDGNYIYVLGLTDSSLVVFQRNRDHMSPDHGFLRVIQNMINGDNGVSGLYSPSDMAISPDDQHVYITTLDSVLVIQRLPVLIFGSGFQ